MFNYKTLNYEKKSIIVNMFIVLIFLRHIIHPQQTTHNIYGYA